MGESMTPFSFGGQAHWGALLTIVIAGAAMIQRRRKHPIPSASRPLELTLALSLFVAFLYKPMSHLWFGTLDPKLGLPLHFCDMASLAAIGALLTHRQTLCELTYFFGLSGTAQALITPALAHTFPHPGYFMFFLGHGGVVVTSFYVVLALQKRPGSRGVGHAMTASTVYALVVGGINYLLGANYGFLCAKPPSASLMDVLGPWPWYLIGLWLLAWVIFMLLDLPFRSSRKQLSSQGR